MVPEIWSVADIIFVILDCFLPFYTPNNPKNQNFQKLKKNTWRYHHFTQVYQKSGSDAILLYAIWHVTDVLVIFCFGLFFALLPPYQPRKSKFHKNDKNAWRYHHFTYN